MSSVYKKLEDVKTSVKPLMLENGSIILSFSADCGKFGTDEPIAEYEYTAEELLNILHKHEKST